MTLIATIEIDGFPALIGDLMLSMDNSNQEESVNHFKLPTILEADSSQNERVVSGLAQKLALINDRIAIGWAGDYISAKTVIKEIYEAENSSNLTFVDFKKILAGFVGSDIGEVNLACLVFELIDSEKGNVHECGWNSLSGPVPQPKIGEYFKALHVFGSGTIDFDTLVRGVLKRPQSTKNTYSGSRAILGTVSIMSALIGEQIRSGQGLSSYYGGGFEGITPRKDKLKKLEEITYINLGIEDSNDKFIISGFAVLKFCYQNDILKIRRCDFDLNSSDFGYFKGSTNNYFYIPPIYRSVAESEINSLTLPKIESKFNAINIHIPQINEILTKSFYDESENKPVIFEENKDEFSMKFTDRFKSEVLSKINEKLK